MNLNKKLKAIILERFKAGESTETIAVWYAKSREQIEAVIREKMLEGRIDEAEAYRIAAYVGNVVEGVVEPHKLQQLLDGIARALRHRGGMTA